MGCHAGHAVDKWENVKCAIVIAAMSCAPTPYLSPSVWK